MKNRKGGYLYIMSNSISTTLYIGVTNDLIKRAWQHKCKLIEGFTQKYSLNKLVYFEHYDTIVEAIRREKQLKKWKREWKEDLITKKNPTRKDLYSELSECLEIPDPAFSRSRMT